MNDYIGALADGDGQQACSHLTAAAKRQVVTQGRTLSASQGATSCAATLGRLAKTMPTGMAKELKASPITINVRGDAATAVAASGPKGYGGQLRKVDGEWLISKFASP